MKILINNEEVLCDKNFTIAEEMLNTSSVILNNVFPKEWDITKDYVSDFYYPPDYAKCLIYDDNNNLLFSGIVKNTGNISLNPREPHYCNLEVLDFKAFLSEGDTLDFVITEKTITDAINQVINAIADYGFIAGNIDILNADDVIGAYSTKDKTAYDVFQYLADMSQSRWTTRLVNENTVAIDFYDPSLMPKGTKIEYTKEWFCENDIDDMSFSYASRDYRNKQVMTSDDIYGSIVQREQIIANGYQTQFDTYEKIGSISNIKVNNVSKTTATNQDKELGAIADFYYTPGEMKFESQDLQSLGSIIVIDYIPMVAGREILINSAEIERITNSVGRKGLISRYENRNDATTSGELQEIGKSYLKYKGSPEITLLINTRKNIWNIGETVDFEAPLEELSTDYMVKSKKINYIATIDTIFYEYELSSNYNSEQTINYFDNQRAKTKGNIGVGEYIARNIDIENSANIIFYDTDIEEIAVTGNNILNCVLNSPLNK